MFQKTNKPFSRIKIPKFWNWTRKKGGGKIKKKKSHKKRNLKNKK
jgi:hypothetical protein